jgi:ABC-type nitrate/sulfonate/bicarbonate transport system substrate-binding protein
MSCFRLFRATRAAVLALAVLALACGNARALDKLIVGRSIGSAITFTPLEIGTQAGIWKQNGLDLQVISFGGDAQLQQALIANTVEVGLGSGPALAFVAKGVPVKGIGAFGGRPYNLCLVVAKGSGVKSLAGLKGQRIGVTTLGSLTHWLVLETSRRNGWKGSDALVPVPLGPPAAQLAAMTRGQISGRVTTVEQGYTDEADGVGHIELNYGDLLNAFITHVFFARNDVIAHNPEVLRRFLRGWLQTLQYMKEHEAESVQFASKTLNLRPEIVTKSFPYVMATLSTDLTFDPGALAVLSRSFVELGILPKQPDMAQLYTNQFIPARR